MESRRFAAVVAAVSPGKLLVPVPFDPDQVWGAKPRHHIAGTVGGIRVRAVIERSGDGFGFTLGPTSPASAKVSPGDEVTVEIAPEGPQRDDLADDIAAALAADPDAGAFFDSLAQFYRRAYLRWIDATRRRPEQRAERIAEVVRLLRAGTKARPGRP
jgi:Bacteriocin-protection, YdeI or OmpD-Associated